MLKYKIDIIKELEKVGFTSYTAKKTRVLSQETMRKLKNGDTNISLKSLNRICTILEMQPRDLIKYVETEEDEKVLEKILKK